jgi:hypothetical protein
MWAEDNVKNYPYLLVNQLTDPNGNPAAIGPQSYTKAPDIPPAMAALLQVTEQDMQDVLGNQQAGEQLQPNISGKAVELIQNKLDMQTFIYVSNMAKAVKRTGEVWLSMAKDVYVEAAEAKVRASIAKLTEDKKTNDTSMMGFGQGLARAGAEIFGGDEGREAVKTQIQTINKQSDAMAAQIRELTAALTGGTLRVEVVNQPAAGPTAPTAGRTPR